MKLVTRLCDNFDKFSWPVCAHCSIQSQMPCSAWSQTCNLSCLKPTALSNTRMKSIGNVLEDNAANIYLICFNRAAVSSGFFTKILPLVLLMLFMKRLWTCVKLWFTKTHPVLFKQFKVNPNFCLLCCTLMRLLHDHCNTQCDKKCNNLFRDKYQILTGMILNIQDHT